MFLKSIRLDGLPCLRVTSEDLVNTTHEILSSLEIALLVFLLIDSFFTKTEKKIIGDFLFFHLTAISG